MCREDNYLVYNIGHHKQYRVVVFLRAHSVCQQMSSVAGGGDTGEDGVCVYGGDGGGHFH